MLVADDYLKQAKFQYVCITLVSSIESYCSIAFQVVNEPADVHCPIVDDM